VNLPVALFAGVLIDVTAIRQLERAVAGKRIAA
jgi:hypothetical protein